jgi:hypothetical protein
MESRLINTLYTRHFLQDSNFIELVPDVISKWFLDLLVKQGTNTESEEGKAWFLHKLLHTKRVFDAGLQIMNSALDGITWNKNQGAIICLLHDLGRFYQANRNHLSDEKTKIDHAEAGANLFCSKGFSIPKSFLCDDDVIVESVYWHSRRSYEGENVYAKFARDADKIGIFREFPLQERFAKRMWSTGLLSKEILEDLINHRVGDTKEIRTVQDFLVLYATWFWDLNFRASRQIAREEKFTNLIKERFEKYGIEVGVREEIDKVLVEFEGGDNN